MLLGGMAGRIRLDQIYKELCKMYDELKDKVATFK
jgi:hypothetical protein